MLRRLINKVQVVVVILGQETAILEAFSESEGFLCQICDQIPHECGALPELVDGYKFVGLVGLVD
jgi:hypothetical protein